MCARASAMRDHMRGCMLTRDRMRDHMRGCMLTRDRMRDHIRDHIRDHMCELMRIFCLDLIFDRIQWITHQGTVPLVP